MQLSVNIGIVTVLFSQSGHSFTGAVLFEDIIFQSQQEVASSENMHPTEPNLKRQWHFHL